MQVKTNSLLAPFSTYKIGGIAKNIYIVSSVEDMQKIFQSLDEPYVVIGNGSNVLFPDEGFFGAVIINKISFMNWDGFRLHVGAGLLLSLLASRAIRKNLSGLEYFMGIPATVGGAIFMNAGAHGKEFSSLIEKVQFVTDKGVLEEYDKKDLSFSYRNSCFQQKSGAIVSAVLSLDSQKEPDAGIYNAYRKETQPLQGKSCGCTFRNPQGCSAGQLIESCGLKGFRIGDAEVSTKHANFILNLGKATAEDVKSLICHIQACVQEKTGILLQTECRIIHNGKV